MTQSEFMANRFREVVLNGKWIANTNFKEQLAGTTWTKATARLGDSNSMALLAFHIHYYVAGILQVLKGGSLDIRDKYSFDMPPITSQQDWDDFLERFWQDAEAFADAVASLSDDQLNQPFFDPKYGTYLRNVEGMIEHCYYHLGQVVLLNKLITTP